MLLLAKDAAAADELCPWRRGKRSNCCLAAYKHKIFLITTIVNNSLLKLKNEIIVATKIGIITNKQYPDLLSFKLQLHLQLLQL